MARCHPRSADSAPSTRSAPTCSNSRNDRQPHAKLSNPRPGARYRSTAGRPCLRTENSETGEKCLAARSGEKTCENFPYTFKGGTLRAPPRPRPARRRAASPGRPTYRPDRARDEQPPMLIGSSQAGAFAACVPFTLAASECLQASRRRVPLRLCGQPRSLEHRPRRQVLRYRRCCLVLDATSPGSQCHDD